MLGQAYTQSTTITADEVEQKPVVINSSGFAAGGTCVFLQVSQGDLNGVRGTSDEVGSVLAHGLVALRQALASEPRLARSADGSGLAWLGWSLGDAGVTSVRPSLLTEAPLQLTQIRNASTLPVSSTDTSSGTVVVLATAAYAQQTLLERFMQLVISYVVYMFAPDVYTFTTPPSSNG